MSKFRNGVPESSGSDLWMTPPHIIEALTRKYGALFDPCPRDWDGSFDGLEIDWPHDQVVFVNPPYSNIAEWAEKAWYENFHRGVEVIMLIPARVDTRYFHDYLCNSGRIEFFKGRLRFIDPATGLPGNSAPFPAMLCYLTDEYDNTLYSRTTIPARPENA